MADLGYSKACVWVSPSVPKDCVPCLRAIAIPLVILVIFFLWEHLGGLHLTR